MAILNVNVPFPVIVRLSMALSCRTKPVLPVARPVTTPPMVKGPVLEPGFEPGLVLLKLQPTRRTEVIIRNARKRGFITGFISDCWLLCCLANGLATKHCNAIPSPRCNRINYLRPGIALMLDLRAE